jgi:hypothetical protein
VLFGDKQEMNRGHGINVAEGQHLAVFVDFAAWNFSGYYFTEKTITHGPL